MPAPILGRYRLQTRIAEGGMGEVWRGVDVGFQGIERPVAVKLIASALAGEPSLLQQFIDEAKLSFLLGHQNVVQVRDVGQVGEQYFIAMEWVDGADLGTILRRLQAQANQPLPLRFACLVAVEAARGLDYTHRLRDARGQPLHPVHRDVSPSNLLVSYEGEIKVSDFGIARSRLRAVSLPGALKGKPGYMAPEQARGAPLDARVDVFALGVVLYEMLSGQNPFRHDSAGEAQILDRVRRGLFRPLREAAPTVPQGLEAVVLRAMAVDREARYASCAQMREDLESFARRESYTLSPSDFGQFVRDLMATPVPMASEEAVLTTTAKRLSASRGAVAEPKSFNQALGGALASLDADEEPSPAEAAVLEAPTPRWRKAVKPATVAIQQSAQPAQALGRLPMHAAIAAPADEPERRPTELTDTIPARRTPLLLFLAALALVVAGGVALALHRTREAEPTGTAIAPPPPSMPPTAVAAPPPAKAPPLAVAAAPAKAHEHARRHAAANDAEARLTISSDVPANAFIDDQFVRATPLVDYALPPGRHVVRLESAAGGLRLIPKEETVELKPGELKRMTMELK